MNINNAVGERMALASWIKLKFVFIEQVTVLLKILEILRTVIKCNLPEYRLEARNRIQSM